MADAPRDYSCWGSWMSEEKSAGGGVSINVTAGKEIERVIADILSAALVPASTEFGNLLGDAIGLLSDKVRRKRELNARLGLAAVQSKLLERQIGAGNISAIKEEDAALLIFGMSNTDDLNIRDLWAGLFAQSLDPASEIRPERPFISVLQSLSPMDAKIIDFLAFATKAESALREQAQLASQTPESLIENVATLRESTIAEIKQKAAEYGIDKAPDGLADNLIRQSIIELDRPLRRRIMTSRPVPRYGEELNDVIANIIRQIDYLSQEVLTEDHPKKVILDTDASLSMPIVNVRFTSFGERFVKACGLMSS